jgi:ribose-phosphate pyrophosphokinase
MRSIRLFGLNSSHQFALQVAEYLNEPLAKHEEKHFQDEECYAASLENVRGTDCYVIQSLYSDEQESVNSKLIKLLIMIGSLVDASAERITAVIPYMAYGRQDRKTKSRAPITTKYIAKLLESVRTNRILTIDAHNPTAIQNAFSINVDILEANGLIAKFIAEQIWKSNTTDDLVVMSPDSGGLGRARKFRSVFEKLIDQKVKMACLDKIHNEDEIIGNDIMGKVDGKIVIILDDMISSGKTTIECVQAVMKRGAKYVLAACATHGLFVGQANHYLDAKEINHVVITDTIAPWRVRNPNLQDKLTIVRTAELFGEAIKRTNQSESISDLIAKNSTLARIIP